MFSNSSFLESLGIEVNEDYGDESLFEELETRVESITNFLDGMEIVMNELKSYVFLSVVAFFINCAWVEILMEELNMNYSTMKEYT